ncbi:DotU family type IV/VI secretion system protein [Klebsiella pneumoniae]|nr:DotU family type IV/VI secretion system protein [Klebsiella pneumoniae]
MTPTCNATVSVPLQGYFLGTMDAGDTLCDQMRDVLRRPAPDHAVVTCFQRVMMLGFLGSFRSLNDPERLKLMNALNEYVAPVQCLSNHPVLAESHAGQRGLGGGWHHGLCALAWVWWWSLALWWGLDCWLDQTLLTLLPGAVK